MSESNGKRSATDTDLLLVGVDHMEEMLKECSTMLTHLEARPILVLTSIEQRLEELADAIERLKVPAPPRRQRPWWLTSLLVTLGFVLGLCGGYAVVSWRLHQGLLVLPALTKPAPVAPAPATKKGR